MRFAIGVLAREPKLGDDPVAYRAAYAGRAYPVPPAVPSALRLVASVRQHRVAGFDVFTVTPKTAPAHWHLMYLHGGTYVDEMVSEHWEIVLNLIRFTGATVTVPCYPLAPEHTHDVGNAFVERLYRELLEGVPPERIVLAGDSAGGGMCLVQAMRYRDAGLPAPARLITFAPWADVGTTHPDVPAIEPGDPLQSSTGARIGASWWAGADGVSHPHVSPTFGDLTGLPPIDIYLGTADILAPDIRLLAAKIAAGGGEMTLVEYPGAIHVHVGATFTPEARDTYRRIAGTLGTTPRRASLPARVVTSPPATLTRQLASRLRHGGRVDGRTDRAAGTSRPLPAPRGAHDRSAVRVIEQLQKADFEHSLAGEPAPGDAAAGSSDRGHPAGCPRVGPTCPK